MAIIRTWTLEVSRQDLFIPDTTMTEQSISIYLLKCYPESLILVQLDIEKGKETGILSCMPRCRGRNWSSSQASHHDAFTSYRIYTSGAVLPNCCAHRQDAVAHKIISSRDNHKQQQGEQRVQIKVSHAPEQWKLPLSEEKKYACVMTSI
jgi:hypothetical protein